MCSLISSLHLTFTSKAFEFSSHLPWQPYLFHSCLITFRNTICSQLNEEVNPDSVKASKTCLKYTGLGETTPVYLTLGCYTNANHTSSRKEETCSFPKVTRSMWLLLHLTSRVDNNSFYLWQMITVSFPISQCP